VDFRRDANGKNHSGKQESESVNEFVQFLNADDKVKREEEYHKKQDYKPTRVSGDFRGVPSPEKLHGIFAQDISAERAYDRNADCDNVVYGFGFRIFYLHI